MAVALIIFLATYAAIGLGSLPFLPIDRPSAALIGALLMIVLKVVPLDRAWASIDLPTLTLLLGLMLLAASLARAGFFGWVADGVARRFRSPASLLGAVVIASGVLSALFLNDAVCILFTPLVLAVTRRAGWKPLPFLLGVAAASNTGGACTITGNPQNALIGIRSGIGYGEFLLRLAPASIAGLALTWAVIGWVYRGDLRAHVGATAPAHVGAPVDRRRLGLSLLAAAGMVAAFFAGADTALAALAAGAAMLLFTAHRPAPFDGVDFPLLVLFAGLFVVTEGVREAGIADRLLGMLGPALAAPTWARIGGVSAIALVLSNLVSNVPAVMLLSPSMGSASHPTEAWLTLAMASTFAGNLTIVGSIANLIVAEISRKEGQPIGFLEYLKVGVPLTLSSTAVGIAVLAVQRP